MICTSSYHVGAQVWGRVCDDEVVPARLDVRVAIGFLEATSRRSWVTQPLETVQTDVVRPSAFLLLKRHRCCIESGWIIPIEFRLLSSMSCSVLPASITQCLASRVPAYHICRRRRSLGPSLSWSLPSRTPHRLPTRKRRLLVGARCSSV